MAKNRKFNSLSDLRDKFPDEKSCHQYLAYQRWEGDISCPHCSHGEYYVFADGIRYKCKSCNRKFTAKTDTFMENSNVETVKWIMAMYLVMNKKGISSIQLSKDIRVTQKTAWFMVQRIRWAWDYKPVVKRKNKSKTIKIMENSKKDKRMLPPYITDRGVILSDAQEKSADAILLNLEGLTYKESLEVLNVVEQGLRYYCVCVNPKPRK